MTLDPDSYDSVAEVFDRYSERAVWPITECLMEMVEVGPGQRVLDVACGSGIVTRRAASLVGQHGCVIGIDISSGQLDVAQSRAESAGLTNNSYSLMDAMCLSIREDNFDVVLAQYPHFPDRQRCIGEMVRVLRPGGRFAICNGGDGADRFALRNRPKIKDLPDDCKLDGVFRAQFVRYFSQVAGKSAGNAPSAQDNAQAILHDELRKAGLIDINLWSYSWTMPIYSADHALEWESVRTSVYRMNYRDMEPGKREAFRQEYLRRAQEKLDRFGMVGLSSGALFGTGIKPT